MCGIVDVDIETYNLEHEYSEEKLSEGTGRDRGRAAVLANRCHM